MVSVIILSYNTRELLWLCLVSVYDTLNNIAFEVIVVDNASKDGSFDMVRKEFPKVKLLQNKTNLGFSKGCNIGASLSKGEYLLFLNSDTQIKNDTIDTIEDMLALFKKNKKLAIVGGELQNADGTSSASYGSFYTVSSIIDLLFWRGMGNFRFKDSNTVDWVSGAFMLVKRSVFRQLQGFDEHFFMYVEDMEFCYRAKKLGYTVGFFPNAKAEHLAQGSSNRSFAIIHIYRGLLYFYKKHKSHWEYSTVKVLLIAKAIIAIIVGVVTLNKELTTTYRKALAFNI